MLRLFTTFVVVAAILASPKRRVFIWSYRSSIYRVHWIVLTTCFSIDITMSLQPLQVLHACPKLLRSKPVPTNAKTSCQQLVNRLVSCNHLLGQPGASTMRFQTIQICLIREWFMVPGEFSTTFSFLTRHYAKDYHLTATSTIWQPSQLYLYSAKLCRA